MRATKWLGAGVLLALLGLGLAYWQNLHEDTPAAHNSALSEAINACDLIASKAASALPEALPFQKLEKAARQSRVLGVCMQDHGYVENPAWVNWANGDAKRLAKESGVSENEAFETLRRQAMLASEFNRLPHNAPLYWQLHAANAH